MPEPEPRLTSLAHGGGCGCKMSPAALRAVMARLPAAAAFSDLLVGPETSDDAAVWRLDDERALIATTDFFMPMVDDPYDFGRIAAANALSDVYAMGGRPIFALALLGMPVSRLSEATIAEVLRGGRDVCAAAGVPVAGGHSIDSVEPIYGLAAVGLAPLAGVRTNRGAREGDVLLLTKPLGVGVLSAAFKQGRLDPAGYAALIGVATALNSVGAELGALPGVHAMTDVTGFGLLGHAREMAEGAGLAVEIHAGATPVLEAAAALAAEGVRTGAAARNRQSLEDILEPGAASPLELDLLTDPQTSGGLLVAVDPLALDAVLERVRGAGFSRAAAIGRVAAGPPRVRIRAA